ncbi:MAG: ATP-dependent zinc metalloprotease FtsH [Caldilineaceae bacterium]
MEQSQQQETGKEKQRQRLSDGISQMPGSVWRQTMIWILIFMVGWWFIGLLFGGGATSEVNYSTFRRQVQAGNVASVTIQGDQIRGEFREPVNEPINDGVAEALPAAEPPAAEAPGAAPQAAAAVGSNITEFITYVPSFGDEQLLQLLEAEDVAVRTLPLSDFSFGVLLLSVLPFLLLIGVGFFFFRRMQGQTQGIFNVGKSKAQVYSEGNEEITFEDVAGAQGAKVELREIIEFLKNPEHFSRLGGEIPKGVLLVGPPGTGKTLLARAVAGEAGVKFFSITGSSFMEMFVGVGASRVRDLFDKAKKAAPSIIFIDELDSIGRRRGAGLGGGHDEREQTLNQLLSAMDGFEPNQNVVIIAATNRPDILDPALLRPGRFDRQITVDLPTLANRVEILRIHARNKPLAVDVNLEEVARGTPGFSGADLRNLLNEAALLAGRQNKMVIEQSDIEDARDKVLMGLERENLVLTKEDLRLIAYHEAGHAVLAAVLPNADPIHKVTIVPRGRAMGVTQQLPEQEKYIYPKEYLVDRLAVMMGGRAAEQKIFGTATSGAENDLKEATRLARKMILDWGMGERLSHIALGGQNEQVFLGEDLMHHREYSEVTAREVDVEVDGVLEQAYRCAADTLQECSEELDRVAEALLAQEEVSGAEVLALVGKGERTAELTTVPSPEETHQNGEVNVDGAAKIYAA